MKEIVSQPTNGVICEDGKIAKNGLRVICPFCGEIGLSQGQGKQAPRGRQGAPAGTPAPQTENGAVCPICGKPITKAEQDYSVRKYGREACRTCQKAL